MRLLQLLLPLLLLARREAQQLVPFEDLRARLQRGDVAAAPAEDLTQRAIFLHIPKTGGTTFNKDVHFRKAKRYGISFAQFETTQGNEQCLSSFDTEGKTLLMLVRDPRTHVLSEFMHCATSNAKGAPLRRQRFNDTRRRLGKTPFPTTSNSTYTLYDSFDEWVSWYIDARGGGDDARLVQPLGEEERFDFCYTPINLQTYALVGSGSNHVQTPEEVERLWNQQFADTLRRAREAAASFHWVGLLEYYQQSICMLHFTLYRRAAPYCDCRNPRSWKAFHPDHDRHGVRPHSIHQVAAATLRKVDRITRADRALYEELKADFFRRAARYEAAAGGKLLCD
mmetsp:Transcript_5785/g.21058  ORF Transcript_5785/g.21058 Transcript_5785/m.21058 type:complete len:339 (+) Transcript_5785:114-1130(+)